VSERGCNRYVKGTILKANHNDREKTATAETVVTDMSKVHISM